MKTLRTFAAAALALHLVTITALATNWVKFAGVDGDGDGSPEREGWSELKAYKDSVKKQEDGTVKIEEIKITKCADKASVDLAIKLATGEVIPEVTLEFTKLGTDGEEVYLRIVYCNVTITQIDTELEKGEDKKLEESICITADQKKIIDPVTGRETTIGGDPAIGGDS